MAIDVVIDGELVGTVPDGTSSDAIKRIKQTLVYERRNEGTGVVGYYGQGAVAGTSNWATAPFDITNTLINKALRGAGRYIDIFRDPGKTRGIEPTKPYQFPMMNPQLRGAAADVGLTYRNIKDVPKQYRPFARAGETTAEAIPFAMAPYVGAARQGLKKSTGIFAPMVEAARTRPGLTALAEAGSTAGAAMGAGIAEAAAPDNPWARMGAEITGGVLSPLAMFSKTAGILTRPLREGLSSARAGFTKAGRERKAAEHVQEIVRLFDESPEGIADILKNETSIFPSGAPLSAGAKTESLALLALERKLINDSKKYGLDVGKRVSENIAAVKLAFREAAASGDPEALRALATARQEYYGIILKKSQERAIAGLDDAVEKIRPIDESSASANKQARATLEDALKEARATEKVIWGRVDKSIDVEPSELRAAYNGARDDLLPGENVDLPAPIRKFIEENTEGAITTGNLLKLRSRILKEKRDIRGSATPNWGMYRLLDDIEKGALDDLTQAGEAAVTARQFSFELNSRFSRSYAGRVLRRDPRGGDVIPPELTLERGIGTGSGAGRAVASRELETAVTPFGDMPSNVRLAEMRASEDQVIRDMAVRAVDPNTGQINPARLDRFRASNRELLDRFPALDRKLANASEATRVYGKRLKNLTFRDKRIKNQIAFAKVLGKEDPAGVVRAAMEGNFPARDMKSIFIMARKNKAATAGARGAFLDYAFGKSINQYGFPSGDELLKTIRGRNGEILADARKAGILTDGHVKRIEMAANEARKLEAAMSFKGQLDEIIPNPSAMLDLMERWTGATIGGASAVGRASGTSLVMAGAGSRAIKKALEKVPAARITDVLKEAIDNPSFMSDLLTRPVGKAQTEKLITRIQAKLKKFGFLGVAREAFITPPIGYKLQLAVPEEE